VESANTLNKLVEDFSLLPLDDKEYALDLIKKQLIEAKRNAIARRAQEAKANLKKGLVKKGTIKDLYKELEVG
jgi:hypothetical protein